MSQDERSRAGRAEFVATPEEIEAAWVRLADLGKLDHLIPELVEEVARPFENAGVDLADDRTVTAVLVACRLITREVEQLTGGVEQLRKGAGKDFSALLTRSVARQLAGEACDKLMINVVRANRLAHLRHAT